MVFKKRVNTNRKELAILEFDMLQGKFTEADARQLNPLVLAYIGDSVYDLFIRTYLISNNRNMNVNHINIKAVSFVKAHSQSSLIRELFEQLTDEEILIYKRGRNAKSGTTPKNADVVEYRAATGFEALLGYLYLKEDNNRLNFILNKVIEIREGNEGVL